MHVCVRVQKSSCVDHLIVALASLTASPTCWCFNLRMASLMLWLTCPLQSQLGNLQPLDGVEALLCHTRCNMSMQKMQWRSSNPTHHNHRMHRLKSTSTKFRRAKQRKRLPFPFNMQVLHLDMQQDTQHAQSDSET